MKSAAVAEPLKRAWHSDGHAQESAALNSGILEVDVGVLCCWEWPMAGCVNTLSDGMPICNRSGHNCFPMMLFHMIRDLTGSQL